MRRFSLVLAVALVAVFVGAPVAVKAFVGGPSESGKSWALRALFTREYPRVISVEYVPEAHVHNPDVIRTFGYAELKDALSVASRPEWNRWHISFAPQNDDDVIRFARLLAPRIASEHTRSIADVIGGLAVECHELSFLTPSGRTPPEVRNLFVAGRHHKISILGAAQRPNIVDRCATSEANVLLSFRTHETNDVKWWAAMTTPDVAARIRRLPDHHSLFYRPGRSLVHELDASYRVVGSFSLVAEDTAASA